ncbi:glycosyltransferase [uncultured Amnibacterium sp.]|uniref:glycosyltransferase n=1 Tax=uncultured Amnibacterium sp. TaxID=1631851 RepID=UPI0035C9AD7F
MTRFGFLSTFPPTRCGIATFTASLATAIEAGHEGETRIVRLLDAEEANVPTALHAAGVAGTLVASDSDSRGRAVAVLDECDVVIVQHEYGIYGGTDGDEAVAVLAALTVPAIVVLHTVLRTPTPGQRTVLEQVCALADVVVVMTDTAYDLLRGYAVAHEKVRVIPHGVMATPAVATPKSRVRHEGRPRVLTWGLIGPGKGIEWGIRAMARLTDLAPRPLYSVLGQTHPKVLARHGERYRDSLEVLIDELGVRESVTLLSHYVEAEELAAAVAAADVVLLPYDSREQVTSGVLVEAIAAGVPVVATGFPHAVELLDRGPGIVVAHEDPAAMAEAIRSILTRQDLAGRMRRAATAATAESSWADVARRYGQLASELRRVAA